jgi:hypothetical protein
LLRRLGLLTGVHPTQRRAYYDRKKAAGKTSMEAMRALKRPLSDIVYRRMVDDAVSGTVTSPGGHRGTTTDSNVAGSHPHTGTSDKPLPGPARPQTTPATAGADDADGRHERADRGARVRSASLIAVEILTRNPRRSRRYDAAASRRLEAAVCDEADAHDVSDLPDRLRDFATVSIGCWPSRV